MTKIGEKIRNTRKRRDRDVPCVVASRNKRADLIDHNKNFKRLCGDTTGKKFIPGFGMKNYFPVRPEGEDDASM